MFSVYCLTGSEEQKETACIMFLSGIRIHTTITDYFHNLVSFGTVYIKITYCNFKKLKKKLINSINNNQYKLCYFREKWEEILKLVNCEIVSEKRNSEVVAYLLRYVLCLLLMLALKGRPI